MRGQRNGPLALNWSQNAHFDLNHANSLVHRTVVVGGGISGLQAAISAAKAGHDVLLLEKDQMLGGMCAYYGRSEDETDPAVLIDELVQKVETLDNVHVFTGSKALDVRDKSLLLQHSLFHNDQQRTELSWLHFDHLVIATGGDHHGFTLENHLPYRVLDAKEMFRDIWAYGVVQFDQHLLYTMENGAYRLAMHLKEAGLEFYKAYDGRDAPNSRHIEFAKAVGVKMSSAVQLQSIAPLTDKIQCHFNPSHLDAQHQHFQVESEALIIGYPPQPDNSLWVKAGGSCELDERSSRILPDAGPADIAIVGTAAGYSSQNDCLSSVAEAMSRLGQSGLREGAKRQHNSQVYESPAAYRYKLPQLLRRRNTAFYDFPEATNYYLRALHTTDQTLRQYFANGYFASARPLQALDAQIPQHFSQSIPDGQGFEIVPQNAEKLRVGQMIFVAGQEKSEGPLGIIYRVDGERTLAHCNGNLASPGLNVSVERRGGQALPARLGATIEA
ncbi:FAD-dependent oxidoreductase [Maritalea mediterranea]|uniref:NAD(P)/FAD-dependent oxidoreductase n=1 Tax=Maritalea mediterranea TaxID=2909667 RepID=A0ABS9E559_9HYPH|nr:FAD-dependent oxidoreductase [Maritalea mediterranea]MCF4097952.1 NAD(P)/FAD-dependent oxidoreductase [Maritalea mediterranea]